VNFQHSQFPGGVRQNTVSGQLNLINNTKNKFSINAYQTQTRFKRSPQNKMTNTGVRANWENSNGYRAFAGFDKNRELNIKTVDVGVGKTIWNGNGGRTSVDVDVNASKTFTPYGNSKPVVSGLIGLRHRF
jgi:Attacin, C-terminal region